MNMRLVELLLNARLRSTHLLWMAGVAMLALAVGGCSSSECEPRACSQYPLEKATRIAQFPAPPPGADLPPPSANPPRVPADGSADGLIREHCLYGLPLRDPAWRHGQTQYVFRDGYLCEYAHDDRIPLWVASCITRKRSKTFLGLGFLNRLDECFTTDPALASGASASPRDYDHCDFDPGHHAASADFAANDQLLGESFFMANISPMAKGLNRNTWRHLEERVRDWAKTRFGPVYVISGGFFWQDPDVPTDGVEPGHIQHHLIGVNTLAPAADGKPKAAVSVPTHFFKVVIWRENANSPWHAIAFAFENIPCTSDRGRFASCKLSDHQVSIAWVQERTGLRFFPSATPEQQGNLVVAVSPPWLR
jgi:endonuclease G